MATFIDFEASASPTASDNLDEDLDHYESDFIDDSELPPDDNHVFSSHLGPHVPGAGVSPRQRSPDDAERRRGRLSQRRNRRGGETVSPRRTLQARVRRSRAFRAPSSSTRSREGSQHEHSANASTHHGRTQSSARASNYEGIHSPLWPSRSNSEGWSQPGSPSMQVGRGHYRGDSASVVADPTSLFIPSDGDASGPEHRLSGSDNSRRRHRQRQGLERLPSGRQTHRPSRERSSSHRSRQSSDRGLPSRGHLRLGSRGTDSRSGSSTPLIRRQRVQGTSDVPMHNSGLRPARIGVSSQGQLRFRSIEQGEHSSRRSESVVSSIEHSGRRSVDMRLSPTGRLPRLSESDSVDLPRVSTPDPFQVPDHLNGSELAGLGVPSKRMGNGKPRWVARFFMFTTSQSGYDWPWQQFVAVIEQLGGKHHISRERHADGGYHFHCFVDFERKFEFESPHRFCIGSPQTDPRRKCPVNTHCNILPVPRTPFNTWDYVGKYGEIISSNLERPRAKGPNVTRDDMWTGSMAESNKEAFLQDVKKHSARDYVLFHRQISQYGDKAYGKTFTEPDLPKIEEQGVYVHWERYPEIRQWVLESFTDPIPRIKSMSRGLSYPEETELQDKEFLATYHRRARPKSLIVRGESRLGKTIFATSLGAHIHWHGDFNLKRYMAMDPAAVEYGIFDDVSWKNPCFKGDKFKAWLGGNEHFEISDKMVPKFTVTWGKPCIIMTNRDPFEGLDMDDERWVRRNCVFVELGMDDADRGNALASSDHHQYD